MKQTVRLLLAAFVCLISFSGCDKNNVGAGSITAMVDGSAVATSNCSKTQSGDWCIIKGTNNNNEAFTIYIKAANLTQTTYTLDSNIQNHHASYDDGTQTHNAATGSVTIKSINTGVNVTGAFNFNCTDKTIVTDGLFTALF